MKKQDNANADEEALFRAINEDVKKEKIHQVWEKHGLKIVLLVIAIIAATIGWETYKAWKIKRSEDISNTYAFALNLQAQGRFDESLNVLKLMKANNSGIYKDIAGLQIANVLFEQGKTDDGVHALEELAENDGVNPKLHDIAVIKLASYKLDTAPAEEINNLLSPLAKSKSNWNNIAKEMLAMLAIREGNLNQAKEMYGEIIASPEVQDHLKERAQDMLSVLDANGK